MNWSQKPKAVYADLNNLETEVELTLGFDVQRWKSQRIKFHRLDYFYRFLNPYPSPWIFCMQITKIWQKFRDFWFEDFFLRF
jgi:hypothetical protein